MGGSYRATPKTNKYDLPYSIVLCDTGGSVDNRPQNIDLLKVLEEKLKAGDEIFLVYVFDAEKYLSDKKCKDNINKTITAYNEMANRQNGAEEKLVDVKILGTHADKIKDEIFSSKEKKISKIANDIRSKGCECEILDLTKAKPKSRALETMQKMIRNYIETGKFE